MSSGAPSRIAGGARRAATVAGGRPAAGGAPVRRRLALVGLVVLLVALHLALADAVLRGAATAGDAAPERLDVAFVRTLAPTEPPPAAVRPRPAQRPAQRPVAAEPAASAASQPDAHAEAAPAPAGEAAQAAAPAEPLPALGDESLALADPVAAPGASAPASLPVLPDAAAAAASAASGAGGGPVFEWPPSTRLSYALTGNYRGPVQGQASVEWLRSGSRYQVHLEVSIGPSFAPLVRRRLSSDGELSEHGLAPRRYDEVTSAAFRDPKQQTVRFDAERVLLANGREAPAPPGVQDTASQFVQMTWLFTTQPALLEPGRSVQIQLALPRRVDLWTYDVLGHETLHTPFGELRTVHVKPRRAPRPGRELTAEMWIAPTLQYLPVRIVIRQDDETWVDLLIRELPRQSG